MSDKDRRLALRVGGRLEVEFASDGPPVQAHVEDLSEAGMYVNTEQKLQAGRDMEFTIHLPDAEPEKPVRGSGVVVWSGPTGMGIEFREVEEGDRERIRQFVAAVHFGQPTDLPASE